MDDILDEMMAIWFANAIKAIAYDAQTSQTPCPRTPSMQTTQIYSSPLESLRLKLPLTLLFRRLLLKLCRTL